MMTNEPGYDENAWFDFSGQFVNKLIKAKEDWSRLSENEQDLAALWRLEADLYNGGFLQFFCNWGYDCYLFAVRGLTKISARRSLEIISSAFRIIQRLEDEGQPLVELWDIPKFLTESERKQLDALDEAFWEDPDQLSQKAMAYYQKGTR